MKLLTTLSDSIVKPFTRFTSLILIPVVLVFLPCFGQTQDHSLMKFNSSISPQVKSWTFLRNIIGSNFSDAKTPILDNGFVIESTAAVDGGTAYYFESSDALYIYPSGRETKDAYTVGVKNGKIVSVSLSFMVLKEKDHRSLTEKWEPFEKAFLRDNYKRVDETNDLTDGQTKIVRNYSNSGQHTKMRVIILKKGDIYQMVDVILCNEDIDLGSEE